MPASETQSPQRASDALERGEAPQARAELAVWGQATPTLATLEHYAKLGLKRLELRRAWSAPRGPQEDAQFDRLLEALRRTPLPFEELALMAAWREARSRPALLELRPTVTGFAPSAALPERTV